MRYHQYRETHHSIRNDSEEIVAVQLKRIDKFSTTFAPYVVQAVLGFPETMKEWVKFPKWAIQMQIDANLYCDSQTGAVFIAHTLL